MKHTWRIRIVTLAAAACIALSSMPVFADRTKQITVHFEDITAADTATLFGEAKVKVSVQGADGNVSIAQTALDFSGDLKYKSVSYLKGLDNPGGGDSQITGVNGNKITTGIISSKSGMNFGSSEDLFVITFSGEPGKETTLSLSDLENTYFTIDGKEYFPDSKTQITVKASEKENKGKTASVKLTMDKVTGFSGAAKTGIALKITSEKTDNYSIDTVLDNTIISKGGPRDGTSTIPKFVVENTVLADDTYTVELSGIGYITYTKTGVTFDKALEITNAEFVPGDVNGDGRVDANDKALAEEYVKNGEKNEAADFNRDGKVDADDLAVFDGISGKDDGNGGGGTGGGSAGGSDYTPSNPGTATTPENPTNGETFTDLENYAWAKDAVYALKNKGIISGISDTEFAPANDIKRCDFILILTRMLSVNNEFTENFADVPETAYYYRAVGSAKAAGIAQGSGENFMPENNITRQDLITLAYRAFLAKGYITETDGFTSLDAFADRGDISDYAQTAMASMVSAGIIQGSNGNVNPKGNATRAEAAVMCARLCELVR